jgi:hypothetical protein
MCVQVYIMVQVRPRGLHESVKRVGVDLLMGLASEMHRR